MLQTKFSETLFDKTCRRVFNLKHTAELLKPSKKIKCSAESFESSVKRLKALPRVCFITRLMLSQSTAMGKSFNVTHTEKPGFTQFNARIYWKRSLAVSDLFHMFTQSVKFYTFHCHILTSPDVLSKMIHQINIAWMVAPLSNSYGKIWVSFWS